MWWSIHSSIATIIINVSNDSKYPMNFSIDNVVSSFFEILNIHLFVLKSSWNAFSTKDHS